MAASRQYLARSTSPDRMQNGDAASIVIRHEALNIEPNGTGDDANAFVMEARLSAVRR